MSYDGATVEIQNWDKFNPRKDLKATNWFRLQNSLFEDPNFFDFSQGQLLFWVYLLSCASKKQSGTIRLSVAHAERVGRFSPKDISEALKKLEELQCVRITLLVRHADVTSTSRARHTTNERTNERDERNETGTHDTRTSRGANAGAFIAAYCSAWKTRYQTRPEIPGKEQGIAKRLCEGIGTERASELVASFLKMNNAWFVTKRHDLTTFEQNLNAVVQFHDTGQTVSTLQARQGELHDSNVQAVKDYLAEGAAV